MLTTEDKAKKFVEQQLEIAERNHERKKAELEIEIKSLRILIPLGFNFVCVHGGYGRSEGYVSINSTTSDRVSDKELRAVQKALRKFPYSYRYGGVTVLRKWKAA